MSTTLNWAEAAALSFDATPLRFPTPGSLAQAIDRTTVNTPALAMIDEALIWAFNTSDARLIISMPPQEGKSTRVTKTGPLWMLTQNPNLRIAIVAYNQDLAEGFGGEIRHWVTTNQGQEGTLDIGLRLAKDHGAKARWGLAGSKGSVYCVGITGGITGKPVDALFIDDPIKGRDEAESITYRNQAWNFWTSSGRPRLAPGGPVIIIMTRWHEDDLAGRLQSAADGHLWRVINIPALADHDPAKGQTDPLGRQPGQWLDSARTDPKTGLRRTAAQWEATRVATGSRDFNALYQGRPSPDSGNVWKRQWWRRYDTLLWSVNADGTYQVECDELILSWDMAFKDTKGSDFVVGQVWGRRGAQVFLLDQVHKRLSFTDTLTAFQAQAHLWPQATLKLVEDKANGTAVIDTLKKRIPGIVPVNPTESKYARANAVAPFIEAGNVFLPSAEVALFDVEGLIEEAAAFDNGAHDDQVDATSQALKRLLLRAGQGAIWLDYLKQRQTAGAPDPEGAVA